MRLGLDARILTLAVGGVGRYALSLTEALARYGPPDLELWLLDGPGAPEAEMLPSRARRWRGARGVRSTILRSSLCLPMGVMATRLDLFHAMNYGSAPLWGTCPLVATLHDLAPFLTPEHFTFKQRAVARVQLQRLARTATRFIAVSETTRADAIERLGLMPERVKVVPLAPAPHMRRTSDPWPVRVRHGLEKPYLLAVGTIEPRKNLPRLLAAFRALVETNRDRGHVLALVGRPGWLAGEAWRKFGDPLLAGRVATLGFVPDEDLPHLYTGATAVLYPSLYEGFGLPVLEAMACGAPVVTSRAGAIPEVASGAALLVEPTSTDELAEAIARILDDAALRASLSVRGVERAARYSWRATAERTLAIYREAVLDGRASASA